MILGVVVVSRAVDFYDSNLAMALCDTAFLFLPALMKGELKTCAIVFTIHSFSQILSLSIRNLPLYLTNINFATTILMVAEMYLWLVLCYVIFNYKEKEE
jgi:hypothetical protein